MAVTTLDPRTALVVIDLQKGIVAHETAHPAVGVIANAASLAAAFRRHGLPVVLVNVAGAAPGRTDQGRSARQFSADWAELVPELDAQASDHLVTKQTFGAFTGTDLEAYLAEQGVTQVVVVGISTSIGVESTARHAHELGLNVTIATDAVTDTRADSHEHSVATIFPRLAETGTTADVLALLDGPR
ncbi:isochorismatase family protein [Cellulomonas sp. PhB143]|uniref:isochorismatase family protein n=1 Tax=Cellulomonas sp. PhB143 TaxID=2485186 RepID=UPI000F47B975|nr:isochorismatase family protein [Cellulomonas sp. PhB143]ROS72098.1 nicotinamidase-related amidase [Cellulomonas sp. PhB143]